MPSLGVSPVGGRVGNWAARRTARARRAASMCAVRPSSLCMRLISLFTRFNAAVEYLLALQEVLGCVRKACASLLPFSAHRTAIFARQGALLIAHLAQTLAQRLEVIKRAVIDFRMVTAQNDLMLVIAENAALEFTGYGHGGPLRPVGVIAVLVMTLLREKMSYGGLERLLVRPPLQPLGRRFSFARIIVPIRTIAPTTNAGRVSTMRAFNSCSDSTVATGDAVPAAAAAMIVTIAVPPVMTTAVASALSRNQRSSAGANQSANRCAAAAAS